MRYEDDEYYDPDAGKGKMLRDLNQIRMDDDNNPSLRKNLNIGEWTTNSSGNEESEINSSEEEDFYGDNKEKLEKSALNLHLQEESCQCRNEDENDDDEHNGSNMVEKMMKTLKHIKMENDDSPSLRKKTTIQTNWCILLVFELVQTKGRLFRDPSLGKTCWRKVMRLWRHKWIEYFVYVGKVKWRPMTLIINSDGYMIRWPFTLT